MIFALYLNCYPEKVTYEKSPETLFAERKAGSGSNLLEKPCTCRNKTARGNLAFDISLKIHLAKNNKDTGYDVLKTSHPFNSVITK